MNNTIPKKVHQIWLGPFDPPKKWMSSWKNFCKEYNWEYYLWDDKKIKNFKLENEQEFDKSDSYQQKADIARYEILYRHGGIYADCDMIWLKKDLSKYIPFSTSDFIGVQEYPSESMQRIGPPYLSNGFFASSVKNDILKRCIDNIPDRIAMNTTHTYIKTGPTLLNSCVKEVISIIPYYYIFPKDFHWKTHVKDPMSFSKTALVFTYNGAEYDHIKKLKQFEKEKILKKVKKIL